MPHQIQNTFTIGISQTKYICICIWTIVSESVTPGEVQVLYVTDEETKVQTVGLT